MLALHLARDVRVRERLSRVAPEHEATLVSLRRTRSRKAGAREHAADTASNPTSGEGAVNDNAAE